MTRSMAWPATRINNLTQQWMELPGEAILMAWSNTVKQTCMINSGLVRYGTVINVSDSTYTAKWSHMAWKKSVALSFAVAGLASRECLMDLYSNDTFSFLFRGVKSTAFTQYWPVVWTVLCDMSVYRDGVMAWVLRNHGHLHRWHLTFENG